jgi:hypothetical protein
MGKDVTFTPLRVNALGSCWYFLTCTEVNPQAYEITIVAFTQKYLGYHISTGNGDIYSH